MNIEQLREYCLSLKGTDEGFPFDENTLVFKVMGKMFALTNLNGDFYVNLKCDPDKAIELRETYPCVQPGYHMSKIHWNSVRIDGTVSDQLLESWIKDSYELIVSKLTKKQKEELKNL